jgi:beta-glucosidase
VPAFDNYAMKGRTYRYFSGRPLYSFGYGLSYTEFTYSAIRLSTDRLKAGEPISVDAVVRNAGKYAGDAIVEVYLVPPASDLSPRLALKGFDRVHLAAGEARTVHFTLDARDLSQVDALGNRSVQAGKYSLYVGGSQPDGLTEESAAFFTIDGTHDLPE